MGFLGWIRFNACEWMKVDLCHDDYDSEAVWPLLSKILPDDPDIERVVIPTDELPISGPPPKQKWKKK